MVLADLLTMRAGLRWDEWSTAYTDPENDTALLVNSNDWMKHMLDRELVAEPGSNFNYNSGATMLLSGILEEATGGSVQEFTDEYLFQPLGIEDWSWQTGRKRITNTGWGLFLRPLDMLTFGRLYLQDGRWQEKQIVPEEWVGQSTQVQVHIDEEFDYGYQWWRFHDDNPIVESLAVNDLYFAWGYGGQFIFVIPHLQMVIVTTAGNFDESSQIFPALHDHIFPALIVE